MTETTQNASASSTQASQHRQLLGRRVLKHGETFAVFDRSGDIAASGQGDDGVFHEGTRFLSELRLEVCGQRPVLLGSTVREDNLLLAVDLTNPTLRRSGADGEDAAQTVHLLRTAFLQQGTLYSRLSIENHDAHELDLELVLSFAADFADIFEVRGHRRARRGADLPAAVARDAVELGYRGLDDVERWTQLRFEPAPERLDSGNARWRLQVPPRGAVHLVMTAACVLRSAAAAPAAAVPAAGAGPVADHDRAWTALTQAAAAASARDMRVHTANERFDNWLRRSQLDLRLMVTQRPDGDYPYAGVPWFNTAFGRDGIITALQYMIVNPELAKGVLRLLAHTQATAVDPARDAEPGKILHEMRGGEMAALGEIPFGRYYGSIDATPLFVLLAGEYLRRTGDLELIRELWPALERALRWIDDYGDPDGDGFFEYARHSSDGLTTQGWKDSHDSVFHATGELASGPVALCEVQAYVFGAFCAAADMAEALGDAGRAADLRLRAGALRQRFDEVFWDDELGTYLMALDGAKRPCRVRSSNAGHALFTGIATPEHGRAVCASLLRPESFSGWGIRTIPKGEARYNPMSYHNGSIWPHDNAIIAEGLARYGCKQAALRVFTGLFEASGHFEQRRMPELFCGFDRRPDEGPTQYPVACAPQAWAAGAVFMLLRATLGMTVAVQGSEVRFYRPMLPEWLPRVTMANVPIGAAHVDLECERHGDDVSVKVLRREADVQVVIRK